MDTILEVAFGGIIAFAIVKHLKEVTTFFLGVAMQVITFAIGVAIWFGIGYALHYFIGEPGGWIAAGLCITGILASWSFNVWLWFTKREEILADYVKLKAQAKLAREQESI